MAPESCRVSLKTLSSVTGITPILVYDPVDRVIASLHTNHTRGLVARYGRCHCVAARGEGDLRRGPLLLVLRLGAETECGGP